MNIKLSISELGAEIHYISPYKDMHDVGIFLKPKEVVKLVEALENFMELNND